MKKHTKKVIRIIGILLFISMIGLNYWFDRTLNNMTELIVVKKEGLDIQKPLDEQTNLLETEEFKTAEVKKMKGEYVTSYEQIQGKTLIFPIEIGNPIPLDALK
ncbi:hypothetical protein R4Z09_15260 [Niallia oryzisoli]|uniref:Uncharacterized protein n=1 Tax=Niallia oryzisoli TaxID=1737571 RepID=A0ABZ2CQL8_9BACI